MRLKKTILTHLRLTPRKLWIVWLLLGSSRVMQNISEIAEGYAKSADPGYLTSLEVWQLQMP